MYDLALFMGNLKLGNEILSLIMTIRNQYSSIILYYDINLVDLGPGFTNSLAFSLQIQPT